MGYPEVAKFNENKGENMSPIQLPVNAEEYEKSGGMRTGLIKAETGIPEVRGKGIWFPFVVTEEDWPEDRRESGLAASYRKFSLQPKLDALSVPLETVDGKLSFNDETCAGKPVLVLYKMEKDSRTAEEGGTGRSFPKAMEFYPVGTSEESLDI